MSFDGPDFSSRGEKELSSAAAETTARPEAHLDEWVAPDIADERGFLRAGKIFEWMDVVGVLTATRHARHPVVTASVDGMQLREPIRIGERVTMTAAVGHTSRASIGVSVSMTHGLPRPSAPAGDARRSRPLSRGPASPRVSQEASLGRAARSAVHHRRSDTAHARAARPRAVEILSALVSLPVRSRGPRQAPPPAPFLCAQDRADPAQQAQFPWDAVRRHIDALDRDKRQSFRPRTWTELRCASPDFTG